MNVKQCSCGKSIEFLPHCMTGKKSPITVEAAPNGNIARLPNGTYRIIEAAEDYNGPRYLNHFADCPDRKIYGKRARS